MPDDAVFGGHSTGFFSGLAALDATAKKPKQVKPASIIDPNATGCDRCPLKKTWGTIASPKMKMSGNPDGDILLLAEGPGAEEDAKGEVLIGPSGTLLREFVPSRFNNRLALQNVVRCRPPANATPSLQEAHACSVHLDADIASLANLKAILGIGAVPLRRFFPGASIMRVHGLRFPVRVAGKIVWYYPVLHPAYVLRTQRGDYESSAMPVFRADVKNFFSTVDRWSKPRIAKISLDEVQLPKSRDEAQALLDQMQPPFGVDIENVPNKRAYEKGARLLTGAVSDGTTTLAFACDHPEAPTTWGTQFLIHVVTNYPWIAHSAAHELSWFLHYNNTNREVQPFDDSMALVRLKHERETVLDLGAATHIHLGVNIKRLTNIDAANITAYPLREVLPYNGLDALGSVLLYNKLRNQVDDQGYRRIIGSTDATTRMELMGLPIDRQAALELRAQWEATAARIKQDVSKLAEVRQYEADRGVEFNIASGEQVGAALVAYGGLDLPRTAGGKQYSTDDEILNKHVDSSPLAKGVIEYREAIGMYKYLDPVIAAPSKYPDGMLHPTYTTMLVATLRLSSRDPNIQNYPARKHPEIRRVVALLHDWMLKKYGKRLLLLKFDYGQLEARVLAMASKDRNLCKAIIDSFDIHSHWLKHTLKVYPDYIDRLADATGLTDEAKVRKRGRDIIKSDLVFNALYGGGGDSIADRTAIPLQLVRAILDTFWNEYRGVRTWHYERRGEYRDTGVIRTLTGRVRRGIMTGNEMINNPIQGTAADIVIEAMNELSRLSLRERDPFLHPRINIHDDLSFIVPEAEAEDYIDRIHPIMTKLRFPFQIVPLVVEAKAGTGWHETEQIANFTGEYYK